MDIGTIFILVIISLFAVFMISSIVWHLPKYRLSNEKIKQIEQYGLIHFTRNENAEQIVKEGIDPEKGKPMSVFEKNMVWTYIANPDHIKRNYEEIRHKGDRDSIDSAVVLKGISEEQIKNMRTRRKSEVVVHIGRLKTENMQKISVKELTRMERGISR